MDPCITAYTSYSLGQLKHGQYSLAKGHFHGQFRLSSVTPSSNLLQVILISLQPQETNLEWYVKEQNIYPPVSPL